MEYGTGRKPQPSRERKSDDKEPPQDERTANNLVDLQQLDHGTQQALERVLGAQRRGAQQDL